MIKPVDEIPMNTVKKRVSMRERLRDDLTEAHKAGVGKYEISGDYNRTYLRQYVREQEESIFRKRFAKLISKHRNEWKERFEQQYIFLSDWEFRKMDNVKVYSVKGETPDKTRVFVEVTEPDEEMERKLIAECEKRLDDHQKMDQEKKKLKMNANDETESFDFSEELP